MADIVSTQVRSRMMSGIRSKNTKPEMIIRRGLHACGFRYRLHNAALPGKPDLVFASRRAIILIHGCFWHAHGCHLFRWPSSRKQFWQRKLLGNQLRDVAVRAALQAENWRILTIWECALKGSAKRPANEVVQYAAKWLQSGTDCREIQGIRHV